MHTVAHNIARQLGFANLALELIEVVADRPTDDFLLNLRFNPSPQAAEVHVLTAAYTLAGGEQKVVFGVGLLHAYFTQRPLSHVVVLLFEPGLVLKEGVPISLGMVSVAPGPHLHDTALDPAEPDDIADAQHMAFVGAVLVLEAAHYQEDVFVLGGCAGVRHQLKGGLFPHEPR